MRFTYKAILPSGEQLFIRKRGTLHWTQLLFNGKLKCREVTTVHKRQTMYFIRFWGPKPGDWKRRIVRRRSMWVPTETLARQLAFMWELKNRENVSAFLPGAVYLRTKKLYRPHSYERAPF